MENDEKSVKSYGLIQYSMLIYSTVCRYNIVSAHCRIESSFAIIHKQINLNFGKVVEGFNGRRN